MTTTTDPTLTENTDSTTTSSSTLFELTAPRLAVAVDQVDADYAPGEVGIAATNIAVGGSVELSVAHVDAGADGVAQVATQLLVLRGWPDAAVQRAAAHE
jgi:hypothetical protein